MGLDTTTRLQPIKAYQSKGVSGCIRVYFSCIISGFDGMVEDPEAGYRSFSVLQCMLLNLASILLDRDTTANTPDTVF